MFIYNHRKMYSYEYNYYSPKEGVNGSEGTKQGDSRQPKHTQITPALKRGYRQWRIYHYAEEALASGLKSSRGLIS
jgi:hypothetical protein